MVAKEPKIIPVDAGPSGLHLNPLEGIAHHLHEHAEVGQEFPILLRLGVTGQHDGITAVVPGELQTLQIILQVQVKERQIVVHLILVPVSVHLTDTEVAVIDAFFVRDNNRK